MEDRELVELYWSRSEQAISETQRRYGKYCTYIANNILGSKEDVEECVNDVYMKLWDTIPPNRPISFSAFIGKVTRNTALNIYKAKNRLKRRCEADLVFEEVADMLSDRNADIVEEIVLKEIINGFLQNLDAKHRVVFMRRYWFMSSVKDISKDYNIPIGTVKSILHRTRSLLKDKLEKEGVEL